MKSKTKKKGFFTLSDILLVAALVIIKSMIVTWYYIPSESMVPTLKINDRVIVDMDAYRFRVPATDITIYNKSEPEHGDVIVFEEPKSKVTYIKRVMGVAGDLVQLDGHNIWINGVEVESTLVSADETETLYVQKIGDIEFNTRYLTNYDVLERVFEMQDAGVAKDLTPESEEFVAVYGRLRRGEWVVPEGEVFAMGDNRDESLDSRFEAVSTVPVEKIRGKASFVLANMKPLTIGSISIPFIPVSFTNFNSSIYEAEVN